MLDAREDHRPTRSDRGCRHVKESTANWGSLWGIFLLLGPPIGGVVYYAMTAFVLPIPGLMGFYSSNSWSEALSHHAGNLVVSAIFSYVALPVAFACALSITLVRLAGCRPRYDMLVASVIGLIAGGALASCTWERNYRFRFELATDLIVTCLAPASGCGWMTRRPA